MTAIQQVATVPSPPYKSPMLDQQGFLSVAWSKWFQQVYARIGGATAPTNASISPLQATVSSQGSSIDDANISLASLQAAVDGINMGRQL